MCETLLNQYKNDPSIFEDICSATRLFVVEPNVDKDVFATRDKAVSAPINYRINVMVRSPTPFGLGRNGCWPSLPRVPVTLGHFPHANYFFSDAPL